MSNKQLRAVLAIALAMLCALAAPLTGQALLSAAPMETQPPESYACASYLLMEPDSGQIILESNADEKRTMASITKIMTIILVAEALEEQRLSLNDTVVVSKNAAGMGGSQVLLDVDEIQTVDILLKSTIVGSANDAAVALAEHLYGSVPNFVDKMNERAAQLGMADTHFVNVTGLPAEDHYTTARDIARMSTELVKHAIFFEYSNIWLDEVDHGDGRKTSLTNTNRLIRLYDGCDGLKTGSSNQAGYCISATAQRGDMRLISIVLGAGSSKERFAIATSLLDYGFSNFRRYPVAEKGAKVRGQLPVIGGSERAIDLMLDGDFTLLTKRGDEQDITLSPNLPESIDAPVQIGDVVGSVDVILDGRVVAQIPVAAAQSAARMGFTEGFQRILHQWSWW